MAGPYAAIRLGEDLIFDAKVLWGRSQNDIQHFLTYTDTFMTTRWLATARLGGETRVGPFPVRPEVVVRYFNEVQEAYVDENGFTIPEHTLAPGRLTFGPEIAPPLTTAAGWTIEPRLALRGVWNFTTPDISARVEGGFRLAGPGGAALQIQGTYGGLFVPDYSTWGVRANLTVPLQ